MGIIVTLVAALKPEPGLVSGLISDKQQHALAFGWLATLARLTFPKASSLRLFASLATFGGVIEVVQLIPVFGRQADIGDWLADCLAVAVILMIAAATSCVVRISKGS